MSDDAGLSRLERARREVADNPDSARAHLKLGTLLLRAQKMAEAEAELLRALELDASCVEAWVNLGGVKLSRFDFAGCVDANRHALEADPDCLLAHYNRGLGHLYLEQPEQMVECFGRVVELDPQHGAGHYHLAIALHALGRTPQAYLHYRRCLQLGHSPGADFIREMEKYEKSMVKQEGDAAVVELGPDGPTDGGADGKR
ncbi:MAG: hypothetical protein DRI34_03240 [Deltaproteobacteria bacterium]|nr:MAG: hypothetical protein DRI34_03240 [Deltaproteobacteria bacterium]